MFADQKKKIAQFRKVFITFKRTMSLSSNDQNIAFSKYSECNVHIFSVRNVVAARLCFHRRLSFCSQGVWQTPFLGRCPQGRHPLDRHPLGTHPLADTPPPTRDGYCSGWYASYWNAFMCSKRYYSRCWVVTSTE